MRHSSRQPPKSEVAFQLNNSLQDARAPRHAAWMHGLVGSLSPFFFFFFFFFVHRTNRDAIVLCVQHRRFVVSEEADICICGRRRVKRIVRTGNGVSFARAYVRTGIQLSVHEFHCSRQGLTIARGYSTKNERHVDQPFALGNFNFIIYQRIICEPCISFQTEQISSYLFRAKCCSVGNNHCI